MSYWYPARLKSHEKEGWWWVECKESDSDYEPGDWFWLSVSPKLRLFDYPGGPARGQLSKDEFDALHREYLNKAEPTLTEVRQAVQDIIDVQNDRFNEIASNPREPVAVEPSKGIKYLIIVH